VKANHVFASLPVADYGAARGWYEDFFGRPPDLLPNDNEACWQLNDGGWVYIVGDAERAGAGFVTLLLDDLDRWSDAADDSIPGMRRVEIRDPDGNRIQLAQPTT
jgi:catechol 2,3-dioxygenase-like lactoylglutathione lyase family enzyme